MKKYVIITDSCSDLEKELREEFDIKYAKNTFSYNEKTYVADLDWPDFSVKEFYDIMRNGGRIITSQVNAKEFTEVFEKELKEGNDILYIGCSSSLSNSYNGSLLVKEELLKKYPDAKIICVDSLNACGGLGLLCIRASELRKEGKSIEEVACWLEENKLCVHQEGAVDNLIYLKRAGRVSVLSSFFGGLFNIKPIIISDINGKNAVVEKVKGRKNSLKRLVERVIERIVDVEYQRITIVHADCYEEVVELKQMLLETLPNKNIDIRISFIGPIIGSTVGPGMVGIYFYGVKETFDIDKK